MSSGIRFAPSPTGRFHVGNLRTAWIARWWATALKQNLIIRSEDIDRPRNLVGAHDQQLKDMAAIGVGADEIVVQSSRRARHWELFLKAVNAGAVYACTCSRREVRAALDSLASAPHEQPPLYDGHCRNFERSTSAAEVRNGPEVAWRFRNGETSGLQDFIVARTRSTDPDEHSFTPSYHWACAIDDCDGDYALIVRAWDLESSVSIQRTIQNWLSKSSDYPAIFHASLITQSDGHRLEKRTRGVTLDELNLSANDLIKLFAQSFKNSADEFQTGRVWGENLRELKLEQLFKTSQK